MKAGQKPVVMLRDVAILALGRIDLAPDHAAWSVQDAATLRSEASRILARQDDAAEFLSHEAGRLVDGIALAPFVGPGAPFGPAWTCHPFLSPAMQVGYKLREADLTRELALLMGWAAGRRGPERARSFLRTLAEVAKRPDLAEAVTDNVAPSVIAEHPVVSGRSGRKTIGPAAEALEPPPSKRASIPRIDLLFEWPVGGGRQAVVVIEAKLGAIVADGQLSPYRNEAMRRAKGGPVFLILLTANTDKAERRHRAWAAARWSALMRRWEPLIAAAGDADPEFARVRAHLWRYVLQAKGGRAP